MTVDEFDKYVKDFISNTKCEGYDDLTYSEAIFLPMTEIVDYLNENGFSVYVCSGTERMTCRAILDGSVNIKPENVIGCDVGLAPEGYEGSIKDSFQYEYGDKLVRTKELVGKCWQGSKAYRIATEIGKQPVMVFGNSKGDTSMAIYAASNNPYKSMIVMVSADDSERENEDFDGYNDVEDIWNNYGWEVVSMKNEWKNIFK